MKLIYNFRGEWFWLSNFYHTICAVEDYDGKTYAFKTAEHAFQAAKARNEADREAIAAAPTPSAAKYEGRWVPMRPDWEDVKVNVMYQVIRAKFPDEGNHLSIALMNLAGYTFVEGNTWGDNFWGACPVTKAQLDSHVNFNYPNHMRYWEVVGNGSSHFLLGHNYLGRILRRRAMELALLPDEYPDEDLDQRLTKPPKPVRIYL